MWSFPRAQITFRILHYPPAGITPIKVLKTPLFCQKCLVLGAGGGWDLLCRPLSLSLLGSVVFPLPGGRGAREERGRRRHHVHPQLRGPGAADRQEHQPEPAPAPVARLERWVSVPQQGPRAELTLSPGFAWEWGCAPGWAASCTPRASCSCTAAAMLLRERAGQTPAGWEKAL